MQFKTVKNLSTKRSQQRRLRIEQLETRVLLAGNLMSTMSHDMPSEVDTGDACAFILATQSAPSQVASLMPGDSQQEIWVGTIEPNNRYRPWQATPNGDADFVFGVPVNFTGFATAKVVVIAKQTTSANYNVSVSVAKAEGSTATSSDQGPVNLAKGQVLEIDVSAAFPAGLRAGKDNVALNFTADKKFALQILGLRFVFEGVAGSQGPSGVAGPQGSVGPIGPQGADGAQGPIGPAGATGAVGAAGPQGVSGPAGPQGLAGPIGSQGADGAQGPIGPTGADGAVGAPGPQGVSGPTGPQGLAGPIGPQGADGPQGSIGPTGANGAVGAAGPQGVTGPAGPQGPAGSIGPQGADGAQGPIGPTGANGAVGAAGPQGVSGPAGPQGPAGATGTQGLAGPQGPAGANGATGAQGPQGLQGPAGADASVDHDGTLMGDGSTANPLRIFQVPTSTFVGPIDATTLGGLSAVDYLKLADAEARYALNNHTTDASSITGTLSDSRLSSNVALLSSLSSSSTINGASNPVDWTRLKNVPPGFADGTDDTGLPLTGGALSGDLSVNGSFNVSEDITSGGAIVAAGAITVGNSTGPAITAGQIRYNGGQLQVSNGSSWNSVISSDGSAIQLPSGTSVQRPAAATTGMTRFNTDISQIEFYDGAVWIPSDSTPIGGVVQVSQAQFNSTSIATSVIPFDNTIPQITEGTALLASTIVPKFSTSDLLIEVVAYVYETSNNSNVISAAVFRNSASSAVAATYVDVVGFNSSYIQQSIRTLTMQFRVPANSTAATTFQLHIGGDGGPVGVNPPVFGNSLISSIKVSEIRK